MFHLRSAFAWIVVINTIQICSGCSLTESWSEQTFLQRASQADIIVNGIVTNRYLMPGYEPTSLPDVYIAEFEIYCVFRESYVGAECLPVTEGDCFDECYTDDGCSYGQMCCSNSCGHTCQQLNSTIERYMNVTEMGYYTSCSTTTVEEGKEYIILLKTNNDEEFIPDDINLQSAAFLDSDDHFSKLGMLCDIGTIPPTGQPACQQNVVDRNIHVVDCCYSGSASLFVGSTFFAFIPLLSFILSM